MLLAMFPIRKVYDYDGGGGSKEYNDFPSKICCLTGPNFFIGELFCVAEIFGNPKGL